MLGAEAGRGNGGDRMRAADFVIGRDRRRRGVMLVEPPDIREADAGGGEAGREDKLPCPNATGELRARVRKGHWQDRLDGHGLP